jgi:hypothetical protein
MAVTRVEMSAFYSPGVGLCNTQGPVTRVTLEAGKIWHMQGDHRWHVIACRQGEVWITQECDWRDYVVAAGEMFIVTRRGTVLVQALEDAQVQIMPVLRTAPYTGRLVGEALS